jgi:hypothetical protein
MHLTSVNRLQSHSSMARVPTLSVMTTRRTIAGRTSVLAVATRVSGCSLHLLVLQSSIDFHSLSFSTRTLAVMGSPGSHADSVISRNSDTTDRLDDGKEGNDGDEIRGP